MRFTFWRLYAVMALAVAGYAASRLSPDRVAAAATPIPAPASFSPWVDGSAPAFVTQSADGRTLYFWSDAITPRVPTIHKLAIQGEMAAPPEQPKPVSAEDLMRATPIQPAPR